MDVEKNYQLAKEMYAELGVNTDAVLEKAKKIPVSLHCWQLDDLTGFENFGQKLSGGIAAIGNAPGKPTSVEEYFEHLDKALSLIPGHTKLALHAVYRDVNVGKKCDRDEITPEQFAFWVKYAKEKKIGLDFNPTYFSHPLADDGFTLSSRDEKVRRFWIAHGKRCREIGAYFGKELGETCITNHWIPDGYKDITVDKVTPRKILAEAYDEIFATKIDPKYNIDSVESKLFGLGSESYVTGSHEFYMNYVMNRNNCIICMDCGHFHPTEVVSAKLSSMLTFDREVMLHVSRPVRWDSDHVTIQDDETNAVMQEIIWNKAEDRIHIGTDYFDASINRIVATALGARSVRKCLVNALLYPIDKLRAMEAQGNFTGRLLLLEEMKNMPAGAVWDKLCADEGVPTHDWLKDYL